jgi:hypothetical protein
MLLVNDQVIKKVGIAEFMLGKLLTMFMESKTFFGKCTVLSADSA